MCWVRSLRTLCGFPSCEYLCRRCRVNRLYSPFPLFLWHCLLLMVFCILIPISTQTASSSLGVFLYIWPQPFSHTCSRTTSSGKLPRRFAPFLRLASYLLSAIVEICTDTERFIFLSKQEVERSNFFLEVPKIWKRYWPIMITGFISIATMIILSLPLVPDAWRIPGTSWAVILPLALVTSQHMVFPVSLGRSRVYSRILTLNFPRRLCWIRGWWSFHTRRLSNIIWTLLARNHSYPLSIPVSPCRASRLMIVVRPSLQLYRFYHFPFRSF